MSGLRRKRKPNISSETEKLKPWMIYSYASANFGFSAMVAMNSFYYIFFLTDVALIPASLAAVIILIVRTGDMIVSHIVGKIMGKFNLRWGKYHLRLLAGAPVLAFLYTLIFTNLNTSLSIKVIFTIAVFLIAHTFVNFVYAAQQSVIPPMDKGSDNKVLFHARAAQFSSAGSIISSIIALPMLLFFTGGGAKVPGPRGFMITTGIFATLMMLTYIIELKSVKNYDRPFIVIGNDMPQKNLEIGKAAALAFKTPPFLSMILGETCRDIAAFGVSGLAAYYFRYVVQDMAMLTIFMGSLGLIQLFSALIFPDVSKFIDKRSIYIAGLSMIIVFQLAAWAFADNVLTSTVMVCMSFVGITFAKGVSQSMFADAAQYSEWKTGENFKGSLMSITEMLPKLSLIVTGTMTGFTLSFAGYAVGMPATPELVRCIKNFMHLMPAGAAAVGIIVIMLFNKLTSKKVREMQQDIDARTHTSATI